MKYLSGLLLLICAFALPVSLMADQWQEIVSTTQPPARYGHSLVTLEGQVYLFGGYTQVGGYTQARGPVNDFWKFDGRIWIKIADNAPPAARYLHTAVVHSNKMYVFGGQTNATTYLSDMWSYSSDTNSWQEEPQGGLTKPEGRAHHSATITEDGSMIVYGGRGSYGENDGYAWQYNFTTGDWTRKSANPNGSISCHSATIIAGKMYVFGGKAGSQQQSNDIVSYDPVQDTWSPVIAQGSIPDPRVFYAMTTEGTSFWVFGGENTNVTAFNDSWEFNTATKTWTRRSDMISSTTRSRVAAVTSPGREIFHIMFGGMDANGTAISRSYRYVSDSTNLCKATSITADPNKLTLRKNGNGSVTVTVNGEDNCLVEGVTVTSTINRKGKRLIAVSPGSQETDANGQAVFAINVKDKTGTAVIKFSASGLSMSATVRVKIK